MQVITAAIGIDIDENGNIRQVVQNPTVVNSTNLPFNPLIPNTMQDPHNTPPATPQQLA
jgi:hypothetical protein